MPRLFTKGRDISRKEMVLIIHEKEGLVGLPRCLTAVMDGIDGAR